MLIRPQNHKQEVFLELLSNLKPTFISKMKSQKLTWLEAVVTPSLDCFISTNMGWVSKVKKVENTPFVTKPDYEISSHCEAYEQLISNY